MRDRRLSDTELDVTRALRGFEDLAARHERLLTVHRAMWSLLREHLSLNEEDLALRMLQVEDEVRLSDSKQPQPCPSCSRPVAATARSCMYCSTPVLPKDPFAGS